MSAFLKFCFVFSFFVCFKSLGPGSGCPCMNVWEVIHWGTDSLSVIITPQNSNSPFPRNHQLPMTPQLGVRSWQFILCVRENASMQCVCCSTCVEVRRKLSCIGPLLPAQWDGVSLAVSLLLNDFPVSSAAHFNVKVLELQTWATISDFWGC